MEASLLDDVFLSGCLQFYASASQWMVSIIDPSPHRFSLMLVADIVIINCICFLCSLSLPENVPMEFAALPEYFVEDIADFIVFILRYCFHLSPSPKQLHELLVQVRSQRIGRVVYEGHSKFASSSCELQQQIRHKPISCSQVD